MTDEATSEDTEIDSFFEGEEHPEIVTEVAEGDTKGETEASKVETEAKTEVDTKEAEKSEPPSDKEPTLVPIAALHDERRKAHQYKEEVENLRKLVPKTEVEPDPYEDIEAYNAYQRKKWEGEQTEKQVKQRTERIEKSRSQMLQNHDDFVEMENIFGIMTASDPTLTEKMLASGNEVEFAYKAAKDYKAALLGDAPKEETEVEAESDSPALDVPNLAKATAQASNTVQLEQEADIDDIFEDAKY